ncbi:MAG: FtsQ-type POTRA domain-containing protein [Desulfovibrio sp.]|jgi:cell division protein FtsQ|nr:FtsQ-type POTRA domain-containing protein [Desulfovibrio sp.]
MVLKGRMPARGGRHIVLNRGGTKGRPRENSRRPLKKESRPFHPRLPWSGIKTTFSILGFSFIMLVLLGGVSLALIYGYRSTTLGEYFALKTLEIHGNSRLSSREILKTADLLEGANTLALSIDTVETALTGHPWVEEVSVKRVLPGTLIINVKEKLPAFWVLHEGNLYYADAAGRIIAPVIPGKFASLPTLEVEAGAGSVAGLLPDLTHALQETQVLRGLGEISLLRLSAARWLDIFTEGSDLRFSIGLEDWPANLQRLGLVLADLQRRSELSKVREIRAQGTNVWVEKRPGAANAAI